MKPLLATFLCALAAFAGRCSEDLFAPRPGATAADFEKAAPPLPLPARPHKAWRQTPAEPRTLLLPDRKRHRARKMGLHAPQLRGGADISTLT